MARRAASPCASRATGDTVAGRTNEKDRPSGLSGETIVWRRSRRVNGVTTARANSLGSALVERQRNQAGNTFLPIDADLPRAAFVREEDDVVVALVDAPEQGEDRVERLSL
jgi:hypothetical protein